MKRPTTAQVAVLALGLLGTACHLGGPSGCPTAPPAPTPAPDAASADVCQTFCTREAVLNCPGKTGSPGPNEVLGDSDDVPCVAVCRNVVASGLYRARNVTCFNQAGTCARLDSCLMGD